MEGNSNKNKVINFGTDYNNEGDVVYGDKTEININLFDPEQLYNYLTKKDNYLDFYKKYISYFDELDDYSLSLFYPRWNDKKYEFSSDVLVFGKNIIDWIFGNGIFPKDEIKKFYEKIKTDFEFDDDAFIVRRWEANSAYFNDDLKEANEKYSELFDELKDKVTVTDWYLDDICIDGRNILNQYNSLFNKIQYENKYQVRFDKNKHQLSYPDIDRIRVEVYENAIKNSFENKNKPKNMTIMGVGLERCFKQIQDLIFLTIFYGSITHLRLVRKLIANVMYLYADALNIEKAYELSLRMLFLSGESKMFKNLYNKIKLEYSFATEENFINNLLNSLKSLFLFEQNVRYIFLFDVYGRYLNDSDFNNIEDKLLGILRDYDNLNINNVYCTLKAIANNIRRIDKLDDLFDIIIDYINKNYVRFFDEIIVILDNMDIEELSEEEFIRYQEIVDLLLENRNKLGYGLSGIIIKIKDRDQSNTKYDEYIEDNGSYTNMAYNISNSDEFSGVKIIVNEYKERHEERGNSIGYSSHAYDFVIGRHIFERDMFTEEVEKFMIDEYIPLAKDILMSSREILYEKIKHIRLLGYLWRVLKDKDIKENIIRIVHECYDTEYYDIDYFDTFRIKDEIDLEINIMMFDVLVGEMSFKDVLTSYLVICLDDNKKEEVLECISILSEYGYCDDENNMDKLYVLFNMCYDANDIDIRNKAVKLSKVFIGSKYQTEIISILEDRVDNIVFEECKGYIELIKSVRNEDRGLFDRIVEKLMNNKCYDIRWMAEKWLG